MKSVTICWKCRLNLNLSETLYYKTVSRNPKGKQKSERGTLETTGTDTHQEEEPLEEQKQTL